MPHDQRHLAAARRERLGIGNHRVDVRLGEGHAVRKRAGLEDLQVDRRLGGVSRRRRTHFSPLRDVRFVAFVGRAVRNTSAIEQRLRVVGRFRFVVFCLLMGWSPLGR